MYLGDCAGEHGTHRTVDVARHFHELHTFALVNGRTALGDQHVVQRFFQTVFLNLRLEARHIGRHLGLGKQAAKIQAAGFPVLNAFAHVQQIGAANQIVKLANAQLGHDVAHFFRNKEEVVDHVLRLAGKLLAQCRVLRGNTHRAGVEVALAHHDAAFHHQRCGGKAKFVCTQQRANGDVTAGLHLAVGLHADTAAQAVEHQGLLGFSQADFPGAARMLDGRPG